jgi:hypothetical protein
MIMALPDRVKPASLNPDKLVRLKDVTKLVRGVRSPDARNFLLRKLPDLEQLSPSAPRRDNLTPIEGALSIRHTTGTDASRVSRIVNTIGQLSRKANQTSDSKPTGSEFAQAVAVALKSVGKPFDSLSILEQQALLADLKRAGIPTFSNYNANQSRLSYLETEQLF